MQARRLTGTLVCILLTGAVSGCGGTYIRIGKPPDLRSDRETQLIVRPPVPPSQSLSAPTTPPTDPAPTPLERAPGLAAEPPSAAPLPLAASLGQGQGEGLKAEPLPAPTAPVPQVMSLASAVQQLANRNNIPALIEIHGAPDVTLTGEPPRLETALASLLHAATPRHYGAIARSQSGAPVALIVSPYPVVGAGQ